MNLTQYFDFKICSFSLFHFLRFNFFFFVLFPQEKLTSQLSCQMEQWLKVITQNVCARLLQVLNVTVYEREKGENLQWLNRFFSFTKFVLRHYIPFSCFHHFSMYITYKWKFYVCNKQLVYYNQCSRAPLFSAQKIHCLFNSQCIRSDGNIHF